MGFVLGKQKLDEDQLQRGFNEGFMRGARKGKVCGVLYAQCLMCRRRDDEQVHDVN